MIVNFQLNRWQATGLAGTFTALLMLSSCSSEPLQVDVSNISADVEITRTEMLLFNAESTELSAINKELVTEHGQIYEDYIQYMTNSGSAHDPMVGIHLSQFLEDADMRMVYDEVMKVYPDLTALEADLESAFKHLKFYYPDAEIPKVLTYHSGLNYGIYPLDSALGIGLDMYLGRENQVVQMLPNEGFPQYIKNKMDPEFLMVDAMNGWFRYHYYPDPEEVEADFLSQMIYYGKLMYVMQALMPDKAGSTIMKYSAEEWQWCLDNEYKIWKEMVDQEVLYTTEPQIAVQWLSDGPFTGALPKDSPSRVGVWVGFRIVEAYMEEQGEIYDDPAKALTDMVENWNSKLMLGSYSPAKN